jgi:hypothetical protein
LDRHYLKQGRLGTTQDMLAVPARINKASRTENTTKRKENIMKIDTLLNKQGQDFFNRIAWVLLDMSQRQFILAWHLWQQQRNEKKSGQTRAIALLKRIR